MTFLRVFSITAANRPAKKNPEKRLFSTARRYNGY
jgi:hypothetical protein